MLEKCVRCHGTFECSADQKSPCWCSEVKLTEALLAELRNKYENCLCPTCLIQLSSQLNMPVK